MRWSLRDSLSFRDGEERLRERGLEADHTTIWCWVQHAGPELEERLRRHLKPTKKSWRVAEADVCVRGRWGSLSRALDSAGATIDCVRSGWRDAAAAHRLVRQALPDPAHPRPRVINTDRARRYGSAIARMQQEGIRQRRGRPRPVQYVHTIVEPDHRAITRRVNATQGFRDVQAARRTIQGDEAMHMIRKGHARQLTARTKTANGNGLRHDGGCGRPLRRSGLQRGPAVRPPETVVAMAVADHAFKAGREPGDDGVTI